MIAFTGLLLVSWLRNELIEGWKSIECLCISTHIKASFCVSFCILPSGPLFSGCSISVSLAVTPVQFALSRFRISFPLAAFPPGSPLLMSSFSFHPLSLSPLDQLFSKLCTYLQTPLWFSASLVLESVLKQATGSQSELLSAERTRNGVGWIDFLAQHEERGGSARAAIEERAGRRRALGFPKQE